MGNRMSPLRRAIALDNVKDLQKILEKAGPGDADLINEDYTSDCFFCCFRNVQSPLHTAMSYPLGQTRRDTVTLLVQHGADVNAPQANGRTALHRAGRQNNIHYAKLFVEYGGQMDLQDEDGFYPLHSAILSPMGKQANNATVLEYFVEISKPEDLLLTDYQGNTPLHVAAYCDFPAAVACLLRHGASMEVTNNLGKTPVDVAGRNVKKIMNTWQPAAAISEDIEPKV